jgi:hypothetical protein
VALPHEEIKHTLVDLAIDRRESCCRETLTRTHSGKPFGGMLGSTTIIMLPDRSVIPCNRRSKNPSLKRPVDR